VSALAEKLARLRHPSAGATLVATPPPQRPASPLPEELRRLLGIRLRATAPVLLPVAPIDRELPGREIATGLHYIERHYALPLPDRLDARFAKHFGDVDTDALLAIDTETTGLAGGAGTRAFMIGAADRHAGGLRVRQLLLTQMRGEAAMLECFASWLQPHTVLASYNGRCYDAPLLETRYRLARQRSPLPGLAHLDLLFPTRRRYKGRWENCRLATIERQVLGIVREDDLPGSEAPRAWLDWLRRGCARDLRRVVAHNDQDLRSLVQLLVHLAEG
jgi:uncharacterized protein YprB with RNaseH-like and TPR domain